MRVQFTVRPRVDVDDGFDLCSLIIAIGTVVGVSLARTRKHRKFSFKVPDQHRDSSNGGLGVAVNLICFFLFLIGRVYILSDQLSMQVAALLPLLHFVAHVFAGGLYLVLNLYLLYVVDMLKGLVENFCVHFINKPNFSEAVQDWNMLQTTLNKIGQEVSPALVTMIVTATGAFVSLAIEASLAVEERDRDVFESIVMYIPAIPLCITAIYTFVQAAQVTEMCLRVPPLINSLWFGRDIDSERLYVVEYIHYSAAGFYLFDTRITGAMAIKMTYLVILVTFGCVTNFVVRT